jgi:hypothetical protein
MPWDIRQGTSQCSGYGVFKEGTDELSGCHETRDAAERQMAALYASEPEAAKFLSDKFEKYRGSLYAQLTEEEKAFHDALISIAEKYGPFDLGTSSIWVGYEPGSENEDAEIGVKCSNCSFFNPENNGCAILSYSVDTEGKCRLAAIPDGYVMPDMEDEQGEEDMGKSDGVRVGQIVSWGSSGGKAKGKVKRIIRNGSYNVPDSDFTITGTKENPAVVIEVYRDGKPSGRMVGHRMNTLTAKKVWQGSAFDSRFDKRSSS